MEEIYERNGKQYSREALETKFGKEKFDAAIEKFGFKKVDTTERLSDKANKVYERNGKEYSRDALEAKFRDKTDKAIEKFGFATKVKPQEVNYDLGKEQPEPVENGLPEAPSELKKKESSASGLAENASESSTSDVQGSTSLASEPQAEKQIAQPEAKNDEVEWGEDLWNRLKSATSQAGSNLAGVKNYMNKVIASAHFAFDPELGKKMNSLSPEAREVVLSYMYSTPTQMGLDKKLIETQNELKELAEKQKERTLKFEGNITDDLDNENYGQAAYRVVQGSVESVPSLLQAMVPIVGLGSLAASTASGKQEELEDQGEDISLRTALNSGINGVAEAVFERFSVGLAKGAFKGLAGKKGASIKTAKELVTKIAQGFGGEAGTEGLTTVTQDLSDSFVQGREFNLAKTTKNVADAMLIGGAMGGSMSSVGSMRPYIASKTMEAKSKRAIEEKTIQASILDEQIQQLDDSNPDLKKVLTDRANRLKQEVQSLQENEIQKVKGMSDQQIKEVVQADKRLQELNEEEFRIETSNLPEDIKSSLLKEIKDEWDRTSATKEELSKSDFDRLPKQEKKRLKDLAKQQRREDPRESKAMKIADDIASGITFLESDIEYRARKIYEREQAAALEDVTDIDDGDISEPSPVETSPEPTRTNEGSITEEPEVTPEPEPTPEPEVIPEPEPEPTPEPEPEPEVTEYAQKEYKLSPNGYTYTVKRTEEGVEIRDHKGKEPSHHYKKRLEDMYAAEVDYTQGEKATEIESPDVDPMTHVAENSNNASEVARELASNSLDALVKESVDYKTQVISEGIGYVSSKDFDSFGDRNLRNDSIGKSYLRTKGRKIDDLAQELSEVGGIEITPQDIVDFIVDNPGGAGSIRTKIKREKILPLQERFTQLTGLPARDEYIERAVEQAREKEIRDQYRTSLDEMTDQELLDYAAQMEEANLTEAQNYGEQATTKQSSESNTKVQDRNGNGKKPGVRKKDSGKKKATKKVDPNEDSNGEQFSEQNRKKNLVTERIKAEKRKPKNKPEKLPKIIKEVADGLKATLVYGKSGRRNAAGSYNFQTILVKIAKAGDLDTVAHELGHLLDDRFNLLETTPALNKLRWFAERGGSNPPAKLSKEKKAEYLDREGLAEFIRAYVLNPTQTKSFAPNLTQHLETTLDKKSLAVLHKFSDQVLDVENATAADRFLANIEDSNFSAKKKSKMKEFFDGFKDSDGEFKLTWIDKLNSQVLSSWGISHKAFEFINRLNGGEKLPPSRNFELISRVFAGINGKVDTILSSGMVNGRNEFLKAEGGTFKKGKDGKPVKGDEGTRMTASWLIDGLDTTSEKTLKRDMEETTVLLVAERTMEYAKKFERVNDLSGASAGLDKTDLALAHEYLTEFEDLKNTNKEKYDRIRDAADRYRKYADATLKYAVDKGRISKEKYAEIKATNEFYVSMFRIKESTPDTEIIEKFNNMGGSVSSVKEIIHRAKGGTGFIQNPYTSLLINTAAIVRESDRNEVMKSFVNPIKEITREMGDGSPINFSQIASPASEGDHFTKTVYIDGKAEKWRFDEQVYNSLSTADGTASNLLVDIFSILPSVIRTSVTRFPVFAIRNLVRDTSARLVVSRSKSGFKDMLHNAKDQEIFAMYGGSQAGFYGSDKDSYRETMRQNIKELAGKKGITLDVRVFGKKYMSLLEKGENTNRIAEFKATYRKAIKEGFNDYEAGLMAAYEARDLMDFAEAGHTVRQLNRFIPFLNAGIQGLRRSGKAVKEDWKGFAAKTTLYTLLPTVAAQVMASALGYEDEYEQLPAYQRDLYWNFKITGMQGWVTIPKPFELGTISSVVDRSISKVVRNKETAFTGFSGTLSHSFMPFDRSSLMGGFKPIVETGYNFNSFTGNRIVPYWEEGKLIELRDGTKYASRLGQTISEGFREVGADVDPRNVDHIIEGYGTYFGDWALSLSDIGKSNSRHKFNISKSGFARDAPISNAVSVSEASRLAEELGVTNDTEVKRLRNLIETYYNSDDRARQKKLTKTIYTLAEAIRKRLKYQKETGLKETSFITVE